MTHEDDPPNVFKMSPSEHAIYSKLYPSDGSRGPTGSMLGALMFPGGSVAIQKPTREALLLSAQQWLTRAKEELFEYENATVLVCVPAGVHESLKHLGRILAEMKEMG